MTSMELFIAIVFICFIAALGVVVVSAIKDGSKKPIQTSKPYVLAEPSTHTAAIKKNREPSLRRLSVSTWSLRRQLGQPGFNGPEHDLEIPIETHDNGDISLLQLPEQISQFGINTLEICHFHLPSIEKNYLAELRTALADADVELFSLLIDGGDITHPEEAKRERDIQWIEQWIGIAGELDAKNARVIAGETDPSQETMALSQEGLTRLAERAKTTGVRLMTENAGAIFSSPEYVNTILSRLDDAVGLCLDFGTWTGTTKYTDLAMIAPWAESCHAAARFAAPLEIDREDFKQCLDIVQRAGFAGPHTLVYDGPGDDEWNSLRIQRRVVEPYLKRPAFAI